MRPCDANLSCGHTCPNKVCINFVHRFETHRCLFSSATRMTPNISLPFAPNPAPDLVFEAISAENCAAKTVASVTVLFARSRCNADISRRR